jgi:hypothetical protein
MLSDVWKRAAEAAIGAIVVVVAATLSEELARMIRQANPGPGSEPKSKS